MVLAACGGGGSSGSGDGGGSTDTSYTTKYEGAWRSSCTSPTFRLSGETNPANGLPGIEELVISPSSAKKVTKFHLYDRTDTNCSGTPFMTITKTGENTGALTTGSNTITSSFGENSITLDGTTTIDGKTVDKVTAVAAPLTTSISTGSLTLNGIIIPGSFIRSAAGKDSIYVDTSASPNTMAFGDFGDSPTDNYPTKLSTTNVFTKQ